MKKYTIIFASLILLILFSCSNKLEEDPIGILAPEGFFKTKADVEAAIFGAYSQMPTQPLFGQNMSAPLMFRSDMVDVGNLGTAAYRLQLNSFNMDGNNFMTNLTWKNLFRIVSAANAAIEGAQLIDETDEVKMSLEAEGRFLRAFAYYHLVRFFGDVPFIGAVISSTEEIQGNSRTPENEVYAKIIEDLQYAKENLPDAQSGDVRNRATAGTAATVLASVCLTIKDYANAATEAKYVISNAGRFDYRLEADYQDLFDGTKADGVKEAIFTVDYEDIINESYNMDWLGPMCKIWGIAPRSLSVTVPALKVYDTWDARDYRRSVSFVDSVINADGQKVYIADDPRVKIKRPHIAKYWAFPGDQAGDDRRTDLNYNLFRYAEVLLIAAEAINETSGATQEAIGYVNQIRARARNWAGVITNFPEDVSSSVSKEELRQIIREERRLELAFEFKRWYDIKRWGILEEAFGPNSLESSEYNIDPSRDYLFPIPTTEIETTGFSQNFGY